MSSTNKTSNLELSQFIGTDSPKWLTDYNSDMQKIDAGVGTVQSQANATDLVVAGHTSSIQNNTQSIEDQQTAITSLRADVTSAQGSINTINSLIGNGTPTTTDQTIIGAINELNAGKVDESQIAGKYAITTHHATVSSASDGTKTFGTQISEIATSLKAVIDGLADDEFLRVTGGFFHAAFPYPMYSPDYRKNDSVNTQMQTVVVNNVPNSVDFFTIYINSDSPAFVSGTFGGTQSDTWENEMTNVATSTSRLYYDIYKEI